MQGGEHLVPRHGGPEGHGRGILVTHLTDQDDVRVLAHETAHTAGEIQPHGIADRGLADHLDGILHGILEGHDVHLLGVQVLQHGVEGGRLAAARGSGDEDDALRARLY